MNASASESRIAVSALTWLQHALDELGKHAGHVLQAAREEPHLLAFGLRAIEVQLHADAVELQLRVRPPAELVQQARHVRQALGELRADRPADGHLQLANAVDAVRPQRLAEQPQV